MTIPELEENTRRTFIDEKLLVIRRARYLLELKDKGVHISGGYKSFQGYVLKNFSITSGSLAQYLRVAKDFQGIDELQLAEAGLEKLYWITKSEKSKGMSLDEMISEAPKHSTAEIKLLYP